MRILHTSYTDGFMSSLGRVSSCGTAGCTAREDPFWLLFLACSFCTATAPGFVKTISKVSMLSLQVDGFTFKLKVIKRKTNRDLHSDHTKVASLQVKHQKHLESLAVPAASSWGSTEPLQTLRHGMTEILSLSWDVSFFCQLPSSSVT